MQKTVKSFFGDIYCHGRWFATQNCVHVCTWRDICESFRRFTIQSTLPRSEYFFKKPETDSYFFWGCCKLFFAKSWAVTTMPENRPTCYRSICTNHNQPPPTLSLSSEEGFSMIGNVREHSFCPPMGYKSTKHWNHRNSFFEWTNYFHWVESMFVETGTWIYCFPTPKEIRLHEIHNATVALRSNTGKGPGYCWTVGRRHLCLVKRLDYCFYFAEYAYCPPFPTLANSTAVCLASYQILSLQLSTLQRSWSFYQWDCPRNLILSSNEVQPTNQAFRCTKKLHGFVGTVEVWQTLSFQTVFVKI